MKIKRFQADDLAGAVAAVRRELGREAVILTTRRLPRAGWRRFFRRFDRIELAAAIEEAALAQHMAGVSAGPRPAAAPAAVVAPPPSPPAPVRAPAAAPRAVDLREEDGAASLRSALFAADLAPDGLGSPQAIRVQPGTRRLVAFVGPTGAGKTTTIAKLAAHLHLQQGWRVGLVTADTFRVGAVEQLQAYARLLGLPLEVTPTPAALERALERLRAADVVLIDTSGRGHRDQRRMGELFSFLRVAREVADGGAGPAELGPAPGGIEVHLVLSASTRREEVTAIVEAYRTQIDRCLLTKLDECEVVPEALAVVGACGLTLSYCCAGQRVPEDLALAWPDRLAAGLARPVPSGEPAVLAAPAGAAHA